jgi:hypothetical protein
MKTILKTVTVGLAGALLVTAVPTRGYAGDKEWATVGKVLTGVAVVGVVAALASQNDAPVAPAAYCPPPPPPRCEPPPQWIPGHYEVHREHICVPGHWQTIVVPAECRWVKRGHHWRQVVVRPARERRVWVPEGADWRETKVWVPGHFEVASAY